MNWYLIVLAYFIGTIPTGYVVGKMKGVDIKKKYSGNIGGANAIRALGVFWGFLVGVIDVLKAYIAVYIATPYGSLTIAGAALAVVLGNVFNVFLNFKGGKGMAHIFGAMIAIHPVSFLIIAVIEWGVFVFKRYTSLANLVSAPFLGPVMYAVTGDPNYFFLGLLLMLVIYFSHRENIERLMNGTEWRWGYV